jgi:hypothetical protein
MMPENLVALEHRDLKLARPEESLFNIEGASNQKLLMAQ